MHIAAAIANSTLSGQETIVADAMAFEISSDLEIDNSRVAPLPAELIVTRKKCVVSGATDLDHLLTLREFPVGMYCIPADWEGHEYVTDMCWSICKTSGVIQLTKLIDPQTLYDFQHDSGAIGGLWRTHHEEFCDFIDSFGSKRILEIGSGHGHLAKVFTDRHTGNCHWIMVEPNLPEWLASGNHSKEISPISAWFGDKFDLPAEFREIDAVVHSHTLEHMYDYDEFLRTVARMKPEFQIFSVPHQQEWLRRGWQNSIMFEHPQLLTPTSIEYIMAQHGFVLKKKQIFADGHSLFYAFSHTGEPCSATTGTLVKEYAENKLLFQNWLKANLNFVTDMNNRMATMLASESEQRIYIFGAHVFTQYMVKFGLQASKISAILDNSTDKQGKRLYGLPLKVCSPLILKEQNGPIVILRVGAYADEIKRGILRINKNTIFWE